MRPDRPLIVAVVALAVGVDLLLAYCHGTSGMNIAYPLSGSALHIDLTTTGPAVLGGFALIALGLLLLVWALLAAVVHQFSLLANREDRTDSIFRRDRDREIPFDDERRPGSLGLTERRREG